MSTDSPKALRGRPKTLDRDHVLRVAMQAYWHGGVDLVSINEICKRAKVSKPSLYREFKNEDTLRNEVLLAYQEKVLAPIYALIADDKPFQETLEILIALITWETGTSQPTKGCLFIKLREARAYMGEATRKQIDRVEEELLAVFEGWVERSKAKGEFTADMSAEFAAIYIDAQISYGFVQMVRGVPSNTVKAILTTAFSMLV